MRNRTPTSAAATLCAVISVLLVAGFPAQPANAATCDLTGQWRSTIGVIDLVYAPYETVMSAGGLVRPTGNTEVPPPEVVTADGAINGTIRTESGLGRLDGVVDDGRIDVKWAQPESFAPPADAGDGYFEISEDCAQLTGQFRGGFDGPYTGSWKARRVQAAADGADQDILARDLAELDERLVAAAALRATLPEDTFEVGALAEALGPDLDAIYTFVRDRIGYDAYAGVLRGARGTLIARAGNAADQSLLLAALLRAHGFEVRLALGELDDIVANHSLFSAGLGAGAGVVLTDRVDDTLLAALGTDRANVEAQGEARLALERALARGIDKETTTESKQLAALLGAAGASLEIDPAALRATLAAAARDHVWVEVARDGGWVALDPAFPEAEPGATFATAAATMDDLPAEMHHFVRFVVTIERGDGATLSTDRVGGWEVRVRDIMDVGMPSFRFLNVTMDEPEGAARGWSADQLRTAVMTMTEEWFETGSTFHPVLLLSNGEVQAGTGFDLEGRLISDDWQLRLANDAAAAIGEGFAKPTQVLDSLFGGGTPAAAPKPTLTAQWIEYQIAGPGRETIVYTRTVFDRIGPANRAAGLATLAEGALGDDAVRLALSTVHDIVVTGGPISAPFAIDVMASAFQANRPLLENLLDLRLGRKTFDPSIFSGAVRYPKELLSFIMLKQGIARGAAEAHGLPFIQTAPHIAAYQRAFIDRGEKDYGASRRFDIVHADYEPVPGEGTPASRIAALQRAYGIGITTLERDLIPVVLGEECPRCATEQAVSATSVMQQARTAQVPIRLLTTATPREDLDTLQLDADVRAALAQSLDAGYWIAVPEGPVTLAGRDMIGWWRMEPGSGEVLGMMQSGAGEGYTEYIIIAALIIVPGNIGAFFHTLLAAPFDDNDQSALEVITCALVGAICPSLFGYGVRADGSYDSCSVQDSISGINCPLSAY